MCYSASWSLSLGVIGLMTSYFLHHINRPSLRNIFLFYTLMEWTQFVQYHFLDQCGQLVNMSSTYLIHVLVVVQPYLWNRYRLATNLKNREIFKFATHLSILWAIFYTLRLFPSYFGNNGINYTHLNLDEIMVGSEVCTKSGPVHLFWQLPYYSLNGFEPNFYPYLILFIFPSLYEDYFGIFKLFFWLIQLYYTKITCGSIHELPTIWCAISVPILFILILLDIEQSETNEVNKTSHEL